MRLGKAIVTTALAASLVSAPAFAGAEKLAISAAAAQSGAEEGSGMSGTLIGILAAAAIVGGIVVAASGDDDDPESP